MNVHLRVKAMSLAAEASIIRKHERKILKHSRWQAIYHTIEDAKDSRLVFTSLHHHRVNVVRKHCRTANLAYGFVRGRSYKQMEQKCYEHPDWSAVEKLVLKYADGDPRDVMQRFSQWKADAGVY